MGSKRYTVEQLIHHQQNPNHTQFLKGLLYIPRGLQTFFAPFGV
jgi:hypothetical protein